MLGHLRIVQEGDVIIGTRRRDGVPHALECLLLVVGFLVTNQAVPTGDFQKDRAAAEAARDAIALRADD